MRAWQLFRWLSTICAILAVSVLSAGLPPIKDLGDFFLDTNPWNEALSSLTKAFQTHDAAEKAGTSSSSSSSAPLVDTTSTNPPEKASLYGHDVLGKAILSDEGAPSPAIAVTEHEQPPMMITSPVATSSRVQMPFTIRAMTKTDRERVLTRLYLKILTRHNRVEQRPILPLLIEDMSPGDYRNQFADLQASKNSDRAIVRYLWTVDGTTYLFGRPSKRSPGFLKMHGMVVSRSQNFYAVWRLERRSQVRIWRYLGSMRVPGRKVSETFARNNLERVVGDPHWPRVFLNDAAHIDPDQPAIVFYPFNHQLQR